MEQSLNKKVVQALHTINIEDLSELHIVMLPDFFVDHFVSLKTVETTCTAVQNTLAQGGGNLPGFPQHIHQGGNAANTALALARLGMSSHLICRTDPLGYHLLEFFLGKNGVDLTHVKKDGKIAITTALEFSESQANVMIGDAGSVADFMFNQLDDYDLDRITSANLVGVTNWNLNQFGTELASKVFQVAKSKGVQTFFDTGDPSPRLNDIPDMMNSVLTSAHLDILGLNENELRYYSKSPCSTKEEMITAAQLLKKKTPARLDLHTAQFACSIHTTPIVVPTHSVQTIYRYTGAGDAWNAANIFATLLGFADDVRLAFANTFAGLYISAPAPIHPTFDMVLNSIKKLI